MLGSTVVFHPVHTPVARLWDKERSRLSYGVDRVELVDGSVGGGMAGGGELRRWGSMVESWEVEKSREAIQNMKNTGKKAGKPSCPEKQTNP